MRIVFWRSILLFGLVMTTLHVALAQPKKDDEAKPKKEEVKPLKGREAEDVVNLKREVDALETLFHLEPSDAQLNGLINLAKTTAAKPKPAAEASASAEYRKALAELRTALAQDDEEEIETLGIKLAELADTDDFDIDDEFDITDAAMKAAPAALKLLRPAQIVSFLVALDDEVPDPVERILLTISEGEETANDDWKALRDETADEVGWLIHGFNHDAAAAIAKEVTALLDRGHRLKGNALKKELSALEQSARKVAGAAGPTTVLTHFMERELAEFLSNPRATAAMKLRQEQAKKKAP